MAAIVPGARTPAQMRSNAASLTVDIPAAFWLTLRREQLVDDAAPVPQ